MKEQFSNLQQIKNKTMRIETFLSRQYIVYSSLTIWYQWEKISPGISPPMSVFYNEQAIAVGQMGDTSQFDFNM